jgi:hypothetical protein
MTRRVQRLNSVQGTIRTIGTVVSADCDEDGNMEMDIVLKSGDIAKWSYGAGASGLEGARSFLQAVSQKVLRGQKIYHPRELVGYTLDVVATHYQPYASAKTFWFARF